MAQAAFYAIRAYYLIDRFNFPNSRLAFVMSLAFLFESSSVLLVDLNVLLEGIQSRLTNWLLYYIDQGGRVSSQVTFHFYAIVDHVIL